MKSPKVNMKRKAKLKSSHEISDDAAFILNESFVKNHQTMNKCSYRDATQNTYSIGTVIEPEYLGPCEPGTSITLNGIVWLETNTGMLVVNVTWRGRTYVGTLLDCSQHTFAPPLPTKEQNSASSASAPNAAKRGRRQGTMVTNRKVHQATSRKQPQQFRCDDSSHSNSAPALVNCPHTTCSKTFVNVTAMKFHHNQKHISRPPTCTTSTSTSTTTSAQPKHPVFKVPLLTNASQSTSPCNDAISDDIEQLQANSPISKAKTLRCSELNGGSSSLRSQPPPLISICTNQARNEEALDTTPFLYSSCDNAAARNTRKVEEKLINAPISNLPTRGEAVFRSVVFQKPQLHPPTDSNPYDLTTPNFQSAPMYIHQHFNSNLFNSIVGAPTRAMTSQSQTTSNAVAAVSSKL